MKTKNILIAGPRGFIGKYAMEYFRQHKILTADREDFMLEDEDFVKKYESADVIMNFTGTPIIRRWNRKNREMIIKSRTGTTKKLGLIIKRGKNTERHFVAASAIGIYPDTGRHSEDSKDTVNGYLKEVVESWEMEAMNLRSRDCKVCIMRMGVVLGRNGGMLKKILPVFKAGLGGRLGSGKQVLTWIHIQDVLRAMDFILEGKKSGIYNLVSPEACSNVEFTRELARAVHRPAIIPVPGWILRLLYGKAAMMIIGGPRVIPRRLMEEGFEFMYSDIASSIEDIVN